MKRAALTARQKAYFLTGLVFFLLLAGFALYLLYAGIREHNGVELAIAGIFLYFFTPCALGYPGFVRLPPFGVDETTLWVGERKIPLEAIHAAQVEPWGPCALARENAPTPFLVLELASGEVLALPLVPKGWDTVYEALREARPDLGLLPWPKNPLLVEAVQNHLNSGVHLPQGVRIRVRRRALAGLTALAVFLASAELGRRFSLPSYLLSPLAVIAYSLVIKKEVQLPKVK